MSKIICLLLVLCAVGVILLLCFWHRRVRPDEENKMVQNTLSEAEAQALKTFREKFGTCPASSDAEATNVARIVTSKSLSVQDVRRYLGDPSREHKPGEAGSDRLVLWYDVADSRTMGFEFDKRGKIVAARGLGVGFDTMTATKKASPEH